MTKQEKINVKRSMLLIKDSLFSDQWETLTEEHPYVLQDEDDIEDDVLAIVETPEQYRWKVGKEKISGRSAKIIHEELASIVESLSEMWGNNIQRLNGCAIGTEYGLGFYVTASTTFLYLDGSIHGNIVVTNGDKDEAAYLRHLGYRSLVELWDQYLINNQ
jgi:hypothetical protein